MQKALLLLLLLASCKSSNTKLLLSQEVELCANCTQFNNGNDTLKFTNYQYDSHNRIVSSQICRRGQIHYSISSKYVYDKNDNLIEVDDKDSDAEPDTTEFHYSKNIPTYSNKKGDTIHKLVYIIKNGKIAAYADFTFKYKGDNLTVHTLIKKDLNQFQIFKYGNMKSPCHDCNFKWQDIPFGYNCASNEIIQIKSYNSTLKDTMNDNFTYEYNNQGYPIKKMDSFQNSKGINGKGSYTIYKYIPAK